MMTPELVLCVTQKEPRLFVPVLKGEGLQLSRRDDGSIRAFDSEASMVAWSKTQPQSAFKGQVVFGSTAALADDLLPPPVRLFAAILNVATALKVAHPHSYERLQAVFESVQLALVAEIGKSAPATDPAALQALRAMADVLADEIGSGT